MQEILGQLALAERTARRAGYVNLAADIDDVMVRYEDGTPAAAADRAAVPEPPAAPVTVTATAVFTRNDGEIMPAGTRDVPGLGTVQEFAAARLAEHLTADVVFPSGEIDGPTATVQMRVTGRPGQDAATIAGLLRDWGANGHVVPGAENLGRVSARVVDIAVDEIADIDPADYGHIVDEDDPDEHDY